MIDQPPDAAVGVSIEVAPDGAIVAAEGLTLDDREQAIVHDAIKAAVLDIAARRDVAPHAQHVEPDVRTEVVRTYDAQKREADGIDADGIAYWNLSEQSAYTALLACSDCGRAIQAGRSLPYQFLICPSVVEPLVGVAPCHPGCAVLCGVTHA